jgi:hypothetical protein
MSEDWNPGGNQNWNAGGPAGPYPGQGAPGWPGPQPPGPAAPVAAVSARWPMAILCIIMFWPLGIAACVFAARVRPALQTGDVPGALQASNKVKIFFWISLAIFVVLVLYGIGSSGSSG